MLDFNQIYIEILFLDGKSNTFGLKAKKAQMYSQIYCGRKITLARESISHFDAFVSPLSE